MHYVVAALIGLAGGVASGLFGVGGGVIMVPAMVFLLKTDIKTAIGTSLAVIIPTALSGSITHWRMGNVNWRLALALASLAIVGGFLGAKLTGPLHAETLKRLFGGFLVLVGLRLLFLK
jgi:hypothetical protein